MKASPWSGFTLIEVTMVLGLVGIISAFGVAMSYSSLSKTTATKERDLFVTVLLRGTRAAAIANMGEASHGVYIDNTTHQYTLFTGDTYHQNDPSNRSIPYTNKETIVNNTGGNTIVFEQLSGDVITGTGTISIKSNEATQKIIIREVGQIDW